MDRQGFFSKADNVLVTGIIFGITSYFSTGNLKNSGIAVCLVIATIFLVNAMFRLNSAKAVQSDRESLINPVADFLCKLGGAEPRIVLENCKTELSKYIIIGLTIAFTGILAMLAGGYALFGVFHDPVVGIIFGIFWGLVIMNLDTMMVRTIQKRKSIILQIGQALPRFLLAMIIALTISKPIEIKIFEDRIARQIVTNKLNEIKQDSQRIFSAYNYGFHQAAYTDVQNDLGKAIEQRGTKPISSLYNSLISSHATQSSNLQALQVRRAKIQNEIRAFLRTQTYWDTIQKTELPVTLISQLQNRKDSIRMSLRYKEVNQFDTEIFKKREVIADLEARISSEEKKHLDDIERKIKTLEEQEIAKREKVMQTDSLIEDETLEALEVNDNAYSENLITQLEALHILTKWKSNEIGENGMATEPNNSMWWTSLLITLLFLVIETAPIAAKLLSPMGEYDLIIESAYKERLLDQKQKFAALEYAAELKRIEEQNILRAKEVDYQNNYDQARLEGEIQREFLRQQVGAQKEVIEEILEAWKERGAEEVNKGSLKDGLFSEFVKGIRKALKINVN